MDEYRFTDPESGERWLIRDIDGPIGREALRLAERNRKLREGLGRLLAAISFRDGEVNVNWNDLPAAVAAAHGLLKEED